MSELLAHLGVGVQGVLIWVVGVPQGREAGLGIAGIVFKLVLIMQLLGGCIAF